MTGKPRQTRGYGTWMVTTTIHRKDGSKTTDTEELNDKKPKGK